MRLFPAITALLVLQNAGPAVLARLSRSTSTAPDARGEKALGGDEKTKMPEEKERGPVDCTAESEAAPPPPAAPRGGEEERRGRGGGERREAPLVRS